MLSIRRAGIRVLAAVSTALVVLTAGPAGAQPDQRSTVSRQVATGPLAAAGVHKVTLITGDTVVVRPDGRYSINRAPGRERATFAVSKVAGHLRVVPNDALPLLRSGRLDEQLFDVTALLSFGYDERQAELPLIVAGAKGPAAGLRVTRDLRAVHGQAARARKDSLGGLWKGISGRDRSLAQPLGAARIWLDGVRKPTLDVSVPLIGAPQAWSAGYTGAGVKVAVVDTGIDGTHPDLAGRVVARQNFVPDSEDLDLVGHGTHVASTIAGSGAASGGRYRGVAPDAQLLSARVCDMDDCADSAILAGMQWAAEQGAKVINMSLGGFDSPGVDPLEQAVDDLTAQYGVLFVIAAGNYGEYGDSTLSSPGTADAALTVGATDKSDVLADFSGRGPRQGDYAVKPDIAAPGVNIVAARSSTGFLGEPGESYMSLDGTSMATPHVAGSAALLVSEHPGWTPAQLKRTLVSSAQPLDGVGAYAVGAGRVDVGHAIGQTVTSDGSVNFGLTSWPHSDDTPITKTVTYANSGTVPVTLNLSLDAAVPGGGSVPGGLLTVGSPTVTVPASGTASVTLTADTRVAGPDGAYSGRLIATSTTGDRVSTAFGLVKEVESYNVTIKHTNRDGSPAEDHVTDLATFDTFYEFADGATQTRRVPRGEYFLNSGIYNEADWSSTQLFQSQVVVDHDLVIDADARLARPFTVRPPDAAHLPLSGMVGAFLRNADGRRTFFATLTDGVSPVFTGRLGPAVSDPRLTSLLQDQFMANGPQGTPEDSPSGYYGLWLYDGTFPTGADKRFTPGALAQIDEVFRPNRPDSIGVPLIYGGKPGNPDVSTWATGVAVHPPLHRSTYYNTDGGGAIQPEYDEYGPDFDLQGLTFGAARELKPRQKISDSWNTAVFSPSLAVEVGPIDWFTRTGDTMQLIAPMFGDGAGHTGFGSYDRAHMTLWRNGEIIASSPTALGLQVDVPAAAADYKLEVEAVRSSPLSPKITATWSFRSGHVDGDTVERLPVSSVTFQPAVDDHNQVAAGPLAMVPLRVDAQPYSHTQPLAKLTVEASTDDGGTWSPATVLHLGGSWFALVPQRSKALVSLRVNGSDASGKVVVTETIIGAYQVK